MVFCFGELILRMSPALSGKWIEDSVMPVFVGGAELNAATALAGWKVPVAYCTALPQNYLGDEIIEYITAKGIVNKIHRSGNRIASYYLPQGADLKTAGVIYDRAGSSFASLKPGMIDWNKELNGCTWFHFSAISPALTAQTAALCLEALEVASAKGLKISVDLNFRAKLWQYGSRPADVMPELVQYCHVIMGNIWAVESLLGLPSAIGDSNGKSRTELVDAARQNIEQLRRYYPRVEDVAYTFRLSEEYWAVLERGGELQVSPQFDISDVVDRVGSGDCFMGGLIYGIYNHNSIGDTVDFAAAAAVGKLYEQGDATRQSVHDVKNILSARSIH